MIDFTTENVPADELERRRAVYGPLTQSVRELIDATIRTEVDEEAVAAAKAEIDAATARLRAAQMPGSFGVRYNSDGQSMAWGNAVIGLRNPTAPPVTVQWDGLERVFCDFRLGAAYEGPPGHVHGGVLAMVLDHVLGEVASCGLTKPSFTGTISCRYLRATPLGPLHAEARVDRVEGVKTYAVGHIADAGGVTVEAHGVFIRPKWARD